MLINQYTNADKLWTAGPPKTDAVMIVKKVVAYYDKPTKIGEGACPIRGGLRSVDIVQGDYIG